MWTVRRAPAGQKAGGHFSPDQVSTECGASGIAAVDLVTLDDVLRVDRNFQRAFVVGRHSAGSGAFGA